MTGKLIIDTVQRPNGDEFTFPMAAGTGGVLEADAAGQMTVVPKPAPVTPSVVTKMFDFGEANVGFLDVLWDDLHTGLAVDDIAFIQMNGVGISSSTAANLMFKALSAAGLTVDTGHMGVTYSDKYGSSSSRSDNVGHNSDLGHMQFPNYASAAATDYVYGPGNITFDALLHPHPSPGNKGVSMHFNGSYQQNSGYNSGNTEVCVWDNYGTNAGIVDFTAGFRLYPVAGILNRGFLQVSAILKPGAQS